MTRSPIELGSPAALWSTTAVWAALQAAVFREPGLGPIADGIAHLEDGGGSWFDLAPLPDGRASIVGFDRGVGDIDLQGRDDLIAAGAPAWWFVAPDPDIGHANFAYGYDGAAWTVVGHVDGLTVDEHYVDSASWILDYAQESYDAGADDGDDEYSGEEADAQAAIDAGEYMDAALLRKLLPGDHVDVALGAVTAALYRR
ncbi:hypothetical protein [Tsukamurella ocularis]|uniref:hypothetical protein n=1 Tax=Tsukamurella ocularis TaxID=1970234 RepID=UPI002169DAA8|nr:hypothetical protein [Tsukamurella ocularis]MCS3782437.1 hypothetical protein [Tsukamurella ocularis]MCS3789842.1 hypothetical protein [Tsukamurella ocularis]MCS3853227.1 hypothetical protein [Tsukamurella ocularis]